MDSADNAELVGANSGPLQIKSSGARASVKLDPDVRSKVSDSLEAATDTLPDRVYLQLENVRGPGTRIRLNVSVNQKRAGNVALFGLRRASLKDGEHGGEGLTYVLDITDIIDDLFLENNNLDLNSLDVRIVPNQAVADQATLRSDESAFTARDRNDNKPPGACVDKYPDTAHKRDNVDDAPG